MIRVYLALAAFVVGVVAAAIGGHTYGTAQAQAEFLAIQNSDLRESRKEVERQINAVAVKQKEYNDAQNKIAEFAVRLRTTDRLRIQAEHRVRIATASAQSCRTYATGIFDLYSECRTAFGKMAEEGARAAASAGALTQK